MGTVASRVVEIVQLAVVGFGFADEAVLLVVAVVPDALTAGGAEAVATAS